MTSREIDDEAKADHENDYPTASSPEAVDSPKGSPKVLVHLVDGLVIEESNQPFEDVRTPLLINRCGPRVRSMISRPRRPRGGRTSSNFKDPALTTVRCENCGRAGTIRTFLKSGRFCSIPCSKRYRSKGIGQSSRRHRNTHPGMSTRMSSSGGSTSFGVSPRRVQADRNNPIERRMVNLDHVPPPRVFTSPEINIAVPSELISTNPSGWAPHNVASFINAVGFNDYVQAFLDDDIDGESLLLLKLEHLVEVMRLPVGVALKINSHIAKLCTLG